MKPTHDRDPRQSRLSRAAKSSAASIVGLMLATVAGTAEPAKPQPTTESALEAEKELGQAMRTNDPEGFCRLLDPDWAIVTGNGELGDEPGVGDSICAAIKSGNFTRTSYDMDLAHARVRVYGKVATVTFKLSLAGALNHKPFSVKEVQTDVLEWQSGGWKSVLTHETSVRGTLAE
jgi:hypothetical protein